MSSEVAKVPRRRSRATDPLQLSDHGVQIAKLESK